MKTIATVPEIRRAEPATDTAAIMQYFPPGYTPRPQQEEAIRRIATAFAAGKKIVVLELPTGGGKSFITQTFARATRAAGQRTHFLTIQKILQDQYESDFPSPEIEILKGRNAYPCLHKDGKGRTCEDAPCTDAEKAILPECINEGVTLQHVTTMEADPTDTSCSYWAQLIKCARSPITLYNFSSFLFQQRIGRFGIRDLMIVDEAHNIEGQLMNFIELLLRERDLDIVGVPMPPSSITTGGALASWVTEVNLLGKVERKLQGSDKDDSLGAETEEIAADLNKAEHEALQKLQMKLKNFLAYLQMTEWVVEAEVRHEEKRLICRPLYAKGFAKDLLFSKAHRTLAVSATILNIRVWAESLGLDLKDVGFVQMGTDFPAKNRPIVLEYVGNMNFKNKAKTMPKLIAWIRDVLLPRHAGERGIIHCHSFEIMEAIRKGIDDSRLLFHERGQDKRDVLAAHAKREDSVIVAPAMHEGIDLKDDLSRFQVIAKMPYPSTQDRVVALRMARDPNWYSWQSALKLVQSYGRSVRSKTDHAVTYITDNSFAMFRAMNRDLLPEWFTEALTKFNGK